MENAKKFFEEVLKTEEAKAIVADIKTPETEAERVVAYVDIAKKLGIELTIDEVVDYFEAVANSKLNEGAIDDAELEQLVGGKEANCEKSFEQKENCLLNDACDLVTNDYDNYLCKNQSYGEDTVGAIWSYLKEFAKKLGK